MPSEHDTGKGVIDELAANLGITPADVDADTRKLIVTRLLDHKLGAEARDLEKKKWRYSTPLAVALTGLITLSGTFLFDYLGQEQDLSHLLTQQEFQTQIDGLTAARQEELTRLQAQLSEASAESAADRAASAEERQFQFKIVEQLLTSETDEVSRARTLLFLARAGVLNQLNVEELKTMAEDTIRREGQDPNQPGVPALPQLSSLGSTERTYEKCEDRSVVDKLTPDLMFAALPRFSGGNGERQREIVVAVTPYLRESFAAIGICRDYEIAALMGQFTHESAGFRTTEEFASGAAYEGRKDLGNTEPGDGVRFKGRGILQVTGRGNYQALAEKLKIPEIYTSPKTVAEPKYAVAAAIDYVISRDVMRHCGPDTCDVAAITRRINGGLNGLEDRLRYTQAFLEALRADTH